MIEVKNLNFFYKEKHILKDINLKIEENEFITIAGPNGSGKTTFLKILSGIIKTNHELNRKETGVILEDEIYLYNTPYEEMQSILKNLNITDEIHLDYLINLFKIKKIINKDFKELNKEQRQLIQITLSLIHKPKILLMDEGLKHIKNKETIIKKLKEENITVINFTKNLEDAIYSDKLGLLNKEIIIYGNPIKILENEKLINSLKLEIPFIIDLSLKLKYYDLIDKTYTNTKELVDKLWK